MSNNNNKPAFWEVSFADDGAYLVTWLQKTMKSAVVKAGLPVTQAHEMASRLLKAVVALKVVEHNVPDDDNDNNVDHNDNDNNDDEDDDEDDRKKKKKTKKKNKKRKIIVQRFLKDPYGIWFQGGELAKKTEAVQQRDDGLIPWDEDQEDIPDKDGGKLSVLSIGGLLNGITGQVICQTANINPKKLFKQAVTTGLANTLSATFAGASVLQLCDVASLLQNAIIEIVKEDVLRTTPARIQELLAPEMSTAEFAGVRKRIYDTVILGRGLHQGSGEGGDNDNDLPTAPSTAMSDMEKMKKCSICGNNDQAAFILDQRNGDVICANCGLVVAESIMHEGSQFRKFEGEADRNHHGDAANPLYSNAHNMGTSLSGVVPTTGAGIGGWGSSGGGGGGKQNLETVLKNAHAYTELNVSQLGKTDRRTRVGYKDRQKKDAFTQMVHAGDALNLHEAVVRRAKELFAGFRDDRELVQQFKGVLAACLCEAFDQLSSEGKHILRQQQQQHDQQNQIDNNNNGSIAATVDGKPVSMSSRALRREELHKATMAGRGGLILNESQSVRMDEPPSTGLEATKAASQWDLEDCRTWLLDASRTIAQTWIAERSKTGGDAAATAAKRKIPQGSLSALEGRLVEHAITLCEHLEAELQKRNVNGNQNGNASVTNGTSRSTRVITPRVTDMSKLGIKWQHSSERGSGGKGGVGGSGTQPKVQQPTKGGVNGAGGGGGGSSGRTAGQILLLKTAKNLGDVLKDPVAGEAIHNELRTVVGKQATRQQMVLREEATRQRHTQMQRKRYLTARLQQQPEQPEQPPAAAAQT